MATTVLRPGTAAYPSRWAWVYDWVTTTDHKKLGILYISTSFLMFLLGGLMALGIRTELAAPGIQFLDPATYNQIFTMHGITMIFLFMMPMLTGFGNYIVPLQIGAADMAFPRINALGFWMVPSGGLLTLSGFVVGGAANTGWTIYPPLSATSTYTGVDLMLVGLILLGTSSILGAINFIATIFKLRAPGMTLMRMPMFVWNTLVTSVLLLMAVPVLTSGLIMLFIDRNYGGGFFDPKLGGNPILWQHLFWFFGHPEVYILILPAFGIITEIIPVFSRKPLFGYRAFVMATSAIGALGFTVWAHHMFTTGAVYLPFFSFFTFLIAVPTGIKFFNWIATMFRGQLRLGTPMLFSIGLMMLFLIGGLDGAFLAVVPFDFHVQDTYWVVSHLHYVLVAGSLFGVFAGLYYWFPKMSGRKLREGLGKVHFVLLFIGTNVTFFPQHILGLNGMIRRVADYAPNPGWAELNLISSIGSFIIALSILPFLMNLFITLRGPQDAGDDPWDANTLEWATTSPPPVYNFDSLPEIRSERPFFDLKHGPKYGSHGGGHSKAVAAAHPALASGAAAATETPAVETAAAADPASTATDAAGSTGNGPAA